MRFGMIDLLFAVACLTIGMLLGLSVASEFPKGMRLTIALCVPVCVYLALVYPFYRGLRLFPMILPRCPCCGQFQGGFRILGGGWPRIAFQCPTCRGEFVIWMSGKLDRNETWTKPVLALKWPYAFGIYQRMNKPESNAVTKSSSAEFDNGKQVE